MRTHAGTIHSASTALETGDTARGAHLSLLGVAPPVEASTSFPTRTFASNAPMEEPKTSAFPLSTTTTTTIAGINIAPLTTIKTAPDPLFLKGPTLLERRRGSTLLTLRNSFDEGAGGNYSDDSTPPLTPENVSLFPTVGSGSVHNATGGRTGSTFELSASGSRKTLKSVSSAPCVLQDDGAGGDEEESPHKRQKSSSYRGVSRCAKDGRWQSRIRIGKKVKYLGRFKTEMEAAERYDEAALALHGVRASLNFELGPEDMEAAANAAYSKRGELGLVPEDFETTQAAASSGGGGGGVSTLSSSAGGRTHSPNGSPASSRSGSRRSSTPSHHPHHHSHHRHQPHHHSTLAITTSASSSAATSPISSATTTPTNTTTHHQHGRVGFFAEDAPARPNFNNLTPSSSSSSSSVMVTRPLGGAYQNSPLMEPIAEGTEECTAATSDERFAAMTLLCLKALSISPEAMLC